jgi:ribosomal protein S18 acetylase RimI-like enzyme
MTVDLRPANREDAGDLARLVDIAGEGLPAYLWAGMAEPGEDVWAVGVRRAARDEGSFTWRNAVIAETAGKTAGTLISYRIGNTPEPLDDLPPIFRPLQALENQALGSHYVNVIAVFPPFRGGGVGRALMAEAERLGQSADAMSLIVGNRNVPAINLYTALGYEERSRETIVKNGWKCDSDAWVLMIKPSQAPRRTPN